MAYLITTWLLAITAGIVGAVIIDKADKEAESGDLSEWRRERE